MPTTSSACSNGVKPHLMVTDPPYGVSTIRPGGSERGVDAGRLANGQGAQRRPRRLARGLGAVPRRCRLCLAWRPACRRRAASLEACGFAIRAQIIWDKTRLVIGRGDYHWQHEPCWYAVRKGRTGHWAGDRKQTTVWAIPHREVATAATAPRSRSSACGGRSRTTPRPARRSTSRSRGSGTTIIAAEMTGRCLPCHRAQPGLCRCRRHPLAGLHRRGSAMLDGDGRRRLRHERRRGGQADEPRPRSRPSWPPTAAVAADGRPQADEPDAGDPAQMPGLLRRSDRRGQALRGRHLFAVAVPGRTASLHQNPRAGGHFRERDAWMALR